MYIGPNPQERKAWYALKIGDVVWSKKSGRRLTITKINDGSKSRTIELDSGRLLEYGDRWQLTFNP